MTHPHRTPELRPPCAPWTLARPTRPGRARSRTDGVGRASVDERQRETWTRRETRIIGIPYGSRTRVAAVKEMRITVIQGNLAAWIAPYSTSRTHGNAYWTLNGLAWVMVPPRCEG